MTYGKHTYGTPNILKWNENTKLTIGNFCSIGANVNIYLGGNHQTNWVSTYPFNRIFNGANGQAASKGDIIIGNDVWIASNVTIMSGVTIGDGAVIANNSHVIKNVDSYSIVGGNPAKFIKYRFSPEQIKNLLEIKWWYWDDHKIEQHAHLLSSDNIDNFIQVANH